VPAHRPCPARVLCKRLHWRVAGLPGEHAGAAVLGVAMALVAMFSASPISLIQVYTPSSSMRCQRHARASALTSVPTGCGFVLGASSRPSGATMRLRPPRLWKRMGARRGYARRAECPWRPVGIATLNTIAPGGWRGRVAQVQPRRAPQNRAARRGTACGGDRNELFAGRAVLTLVWGVRV
jgi:hypothetical protein